MSFKFSHLALASLLLVGVNATAAVGAIEVNALEGQIDNQHQVRSSNSSRADVEESKIVQPEEIMLFWQPGNWGSYFDWGQGRNGFGYCYEWTNDGRVLNGGAAQPNAYCERYNPSRFNWGQGRNGYGYCYQYTPYGLVMNEGMAQNNYNCEVVSPSYYGWGRGMNGYTYCYQYTPYGIPMNEGQPQPNAYCQ